MKKIILSALFIVSLAITSCGGGKGADNIAPAYDAVKNKAEVSKIVELLTQDDIDFANVSPEEYAKLGICLLYVTSNDTTGGQEEVKKLKGLLNKYDKAGEDMTPQQLQEAKNCALQLVTQN